MLPKKDPRPTHGCLAKGGRRRPLLQEGGGKDGVGGGDPCLVEDE
jgi:hypothetical protein